MTCDQMDSLLDACLDGECSAEERRALELHAAVCESCRTHLALAERLQHALAELPVAAPAPDFFAHALSRATTPVQRQSARRRVWAAGLAAACAALAVTVLLTHSPESGPAAPLAGVTLTLNEARTVRLVFAATSELERVSLTVDLPPGVELESYPGLRQVRWTTQLRAGNNVLPLTLVASEGIGGEIVATLRGTQSEKSFKVNVAVVAG
jgi:anti-sigma factor RsiW